MTAAQSARQYARDGGGRYATTVREESSLDLVGAGSVSTEDLVDIETAIDRLYEIQDRHDAGKEHSAKSTVDRAELLSTVAMTEQGRERLEWVPDELYAGINGSDIDSARRKVNTVGQNRERRLNDFISSGALADMRNLEFEEFQEVFAEGETVSTQLTGLGGSKGRGPRTVEKVHRMGITFAGGAHKGKVLRWYPDRFFVDSQRNLVEYDEYGALIALHWRDGGA